MRRCCILALVAVLAALPTPALAASPGSGPGYGDPPGWCTRFSDMWPATVVTNDPLVGTNPERNTFSGFHPNPGYDDWYGYFYGDFRGSPGDASGWVKLLHEFYPKQYSWNFATNGWAVHGHAKQYIAYYNWTFGGQCGMGRYGNLAPARRPRRRRRSRLLRGRGGSLQLVGHGGRRACPAGCVLLHASRHHGAR